MAAPSGTAARREAGSQRLAATAAPKRATLDGDACDVDTAERPFRPTLYLYDNYPGGIGISGPLFDLREQVIARSIELVRECACKYGCPACVGPVLAHDDADRLSPKEAALKVLALLRGGANEAVAAH